MDGRHKYEDILYLPRPVSWRHAPMSLTDRAAQFSPFAALTGYEAVIQETGRLTDACADLDEDRKLEINEKLLRILENQDAMPEVTITYFQKDAVKDGGTYLSVTGRVRKIDPYTCQMVLMDGTAIELERIRGIEVY